MSGHVLLHLERSAFECLRCGASSSVILPMPVDKMVSDLQAFAAAHDGCEEPAPGPTIAGLEGDGEIEIGPDFIPTATHSAEIDFDGMKVKVYVLDNGQRVIDAADFKKLLERLEGAA